MPRVIHSSSSTPVPAAGSVGVRRASACQTERRSRLGHWLIVIIASFGWLFDCMDQRLFILAREPADAGAARGGAAAADVKRTVGTYATTAMILGWATGGIIFGMMSDRWGRVKTMVATLLVYSGFTGPLRASRPAGWTSRSTASSSGSASAGCSARRRRWSPRASRDASAIDRARRAAGAVGARQHHGLAHQPAMCSPARRISSGATPGWRVLFFVGILPSLLVVPIVLYLREPEAWRRAKAEAAARRRQEERRLDRRAVPHPALAPATASSACCSASPGMIGLWGIGFFSPELISTALAGAPQADDRHACARTAPRCRTSGAFLGMLAVHGGRLAGEPPAGLLLCVPGGPARHGVRLQLAPDGKRRLLDAADDGLRAAGAFCRLLDLLPGALPDAAARHGRRLLLQHRALPGRAGADPARLPEQRCCRSARRRW